MTVKARTLGEWSAYHKKKLEDARWMREMQAWNRRFNRFTRDARASGEGDLAGMHAYIAWWKTVEAVHLPSGRVVFRQKLPAGADASYAPPKKLSN